ncbi:hypothetical protein C8R46DRAFT_1027022 [Mycena filopes]|nr:hypothetical protein C8R46DRAFT_1027022 [Mycena filopes]
MSRYSVLCSVFVVAAEPGGSNHAIEKRQVASSGQGGVPGTNENQRFWSFQTFVLAGHMRERSSAISTGRGSGGRAAQTASGFASAEFQNGTIDSAGSLSKTEGTTALIWEAYRLLRTKVLTQVSSRNASRSTLSGSPPAHEPDVGEYSVTQKDGAACFPKKVHVTALVFCGLLWQTSVGKVFSSGAVVEGASYEALEFREVVDVGAGELHCPELHEGLAGLRRSVEPLHSSTSGPTSTPKSSRAQSATAAAHEINKIGEVLNRPALTSIIKERRRIQSTASSQVLTSKKKPAAKPPSPRATRIPCAPSLPPPIRRAVAEFSRQPYVQVKRNPPQWQIIKCVESGVGEYLIQQKGGALLVASPREAARRLNAFLCALVNASARSPYRELWGVDGQSLPQRP